MRADPYNLTLPWPLRDAHGLRPPPRLTARVAASLKTIAPWLRGRLQGLTLEHLWWALIVLFAAVYLLVLFGRDRAIAP